MRVISRLISVLVIAIAGVTLFACKESISEQQASLEENIVETDTVRDRLEILSLLNRHQIYLDLYGATGIASVYSNDALYDSPLATAHGAKELITLFELQRKSGTMAGKRHFIGPAMVDIDGDQAMAISYWWVAKTVAPQTVNATGTYRDKLRRIDGQWKIVHRVQTLDSDGRTAMK
jgi:hypothetical protein